jgi:electron transport complex protein RnfG
MAESNAEVSGTSGAEGFRKIATLGLILFTVTAITGLILGVVHDITAVPIQQTQARLKTEALAAALPEADGFTAIDVAEGADPMIKDVQEAKSAGETVGHCITVTPRGYGGTIEIVVGIPSKGGVRAIRILNQSETPGLGAKAPQPFFSDQFENKEAERLSVVKSSPSEPNEIQAISGATITSNAVTDGVNAALDYWNRELKGGN